MSILNVLRDKSQQVIKVRATDTVQNAVRQMADHGIGAVIVEDPRMRHIGIFSERDFVNAVAEYGAAALLFRVERLMSANLVTCRPADSVEAALLAMTKAKIRHLPVVDEGQLLGIVSIGDLVKHRLDEKALEANILLDIARLHA